MKRLRLRKVLLNSDLNWWLANGMPLPTPQMVKLEFITKFSTPESIWIETGTYLGETTETLAQLGKHIYSLEPSERLFLKAVERLKGFSNVTVFNGPSEQFFESACSLANGRVMFWLDGHYSGGETFKGRHECPVETELETISRHLSRYDCVFVYIDDFRSFRDVADEKNDYPLKSFLVQWAEKHELSWTVNGDIFFARSTD